jgi:hypothetical protein
MESTIKRVQIYRYEKSGRLATIIRHDGYVHRAVLTLSPDMTTIKEVSARQYVKPPLLNATNYQIEIRVTLVEKQKGTKSFSYQIIRILTSKDMDLDRWKNTISL